MGKFLDQFDEERGRPPNSHGIDQYHFDHVSLWVRECYFNRNQIKEHLTKHQKGETSDASQWSSAISHAASEIWEVSSGNSYSLSGESVMKEIAVFLESCKNGKNTIDDLRCLSLNPEHDLEAATTGMISTIKAAQSLRWFLCKKADYFTFGVDIKSPLSPNRLPVN